MMFFIYLFLPPQTFFISALASGSGLEPPCVGPQSATLSHAAPLSKSTALCFRFHLLANRPASPPEPPPEPTPAPLPPRSTSPPAPPYPPLPVSVSFSFQAWNHLIIAYSFFGRLLNAHLSKAGGNNLPRDITHKHTRTHALSLAHTSRERIYYSGSICSSQKSISESRLRKYFCGGGKKK